MPVERYLLQKRGGAFPPKAPALVPSVLPFPLEPPGKSLLLEHNDAP
jgi:hypothetical protein